MRPEDVTGIAGHIVLLDIDGTIVPSGTEEIGPDARAAIDALKSRNDVIIVSNSLFGGRKRRIAEALGLRLAEGVGRKPDPGILSRLGIDRTRPVVVIGDRWTTDGLLARFTGSRFLKVRRLTCADDPLIDQLVCFADDATIMMRPSHYLKNLLVFAPIVFAGAVQDPARLLAVTAAFAAFCLAASAGYILNDLVDRRDDAAHEKKRLRPLAFGTMRPVAGLFLAAVLMAGAWFIAPDHGTRLLITAYAALSVAYSFWLKRLPILELAVFGVFYVGRVVVGGMAADVPVSSWLILCTFFVALLMVVAKRRAEHAAGRVRAVLAAYPRPFLDTVLGVASALVLVTYGLYSILGTQKPLAVWSNVPVVFGVLRYLQLSYGGTELEYPEKAILGDRALLGAAVVWLAFMVFVLYAA